MSTRETAEQIVLSATNKYGAIYPTAQLCSAIDAALTKAIADEREAVWRKVLTIANEHLDSRGHFGYGLRDKLKTAATSAATIPVTRKASGEAKQLNEGRTVMAGSGSSHDGPTTDFEKRLFKIGCPLLVAAIIALYLVVHRYC